MPARLRLAATALVLVLSRGSAAQEPAEAGQAAGAPSQAADAPPQAADAPPRAADAPPAAPATEPAPAPAEAPRNGRAPASGDRDDADDNWIDVGHAFIEQRIFAPILRLDRFFSDERDLDAERSHSFFRWRNEVHFTEDASDPIFTTGLRANLRLPGLNQQLRRLRIVIAGDTRDALQGIFPRRPGTGAADDEDTLGRTAGLRFYFLDTLASHADLGAGVLTRLPPGVYGQVRLRTAVPMGRLFLARSVLTGFWRTDTRFGTSAGLELERPLGRRFVLRLFNSATLTELSQGLELGSELALFTYIDSHTAAQLAVAVTGFTRPALASDGVTRPPDLDRVRLYTRLRRDVYRRWIFAEIEPELAWPWTLERRRHPAWGITFRAEFQFQGKEAPPPPPPDPPPEPPDPPPVDSPAGTGRSP